VRGLHEDLNVSIPAGTSSHARVRLAGRGIQKPSGYGYGDHYIHVRVEAPKALDAKQLAMLKAYAETEADTPGTLQGFTYDQSGRKVVTEDPEGLVADIREALEEDGGATGSGQNDDDKDKNVAKT